MTINYDQATFDQLIALVTQLVKSMPGQPPAKATPTTDTEAPKAQDNANHAAKQESRGDEGQINGNPHPTESNVRFIADDDGCEVIRGDPGVRAHYQRQAKT